jgi:hypothetical protein
VSVLHPADDEAPCTHHGRAGRARVCEHVAAQVAAREPAPVAARVDVFPPPDSDELNLGAPLLRAWYCRACAEERRLPARSRVEGQVADERLTSVCAACLDEAQAAAADALR